MVTVFEVRTLRVRGQLSQTLSGIAFLTFVVGIAFTRRYVVRPVLRFGDLARRISGGDFSQRLDLATGDELSALAETFNDMTEKVERLIEAQHLLRQAVNASSDAIFTTDRAGLFTFVNNGFTSLYGSLRRRSSERPPPGS